MANGFRSWTQIFGGPTSRHIVKAVAIAATVGMAAQLATVSFGTGARAMGERRTIPVRAQVATTTGAPKQGFRSWTRILGIPGGRRALASATAAPAGIRLQSQTATISLGAGAVRTALPAQIRVQAQIGLPGFGVRAGFRSWTKILGLPTAQLKVGATGQVAATRVVSQTATIDLGVGASSAGLVSASRVVGQPGIGNPDLFTASGDTTTTRLQASLGHVAKPGVFSILGPVTVGAGTGAVQVDPSLSSVVAQPALATPENLTVEAIEATSVVSVEEASVIESLRVGFRSWAQIFGLPNAHALTQGSAGQSVDIRLQSLAGATFLDILSVDGLPADSLLSAPDGTVKRIGVFPLLGPVTLSAGQAVSTRAVSTTIRVRGQDGYGSVGVAQYEADAAVTTIAGGEGSAQPGMVTGLGSVGGTRVRGQVATAQLLPFIAEGDAHSLPVQAQEATTDVGIAPADGFAAPIRTLGQVADAAPGIVTSSSVQTAIPVAAQTATFVLGIAVYQATPADIGTECQVADAIGGHPVGLIDPAITVVSGELAEASIPDIADAEPSDSLVAGQVATVELGILEAEGEESESVLTAQDAVGTGVAYGIISPAQVRITGQDSVVVLGDVTVEGDPADTIALASTVTATPDEYVLSADYSAVAVVGQEAETSVGIAQYEADPADTVVRGNDGAISLGITTTTGDPGHVLVQPQPGLAFVDTARALAAVTTTTVTGQDADVTIGEIVALADVTTTRLFALPGTTEAGEIIAEGEETATVLVTEEATATHPLRAQALPAVSALQAQETEVALGEISADAVEALTIVRAQNVAGVPGVNFTLADEATTTVVIPEIIADASYTVGGDTAEIRLASEAGDYELGPAVLEAIPGITRLQGILPFAFKVIPPDPAVQVVKTAPTVGLTLRKVEDI